VLQSQTFVDNFPVSVLEHTVLNRILALGKNKDVVKAILKEINEVY